MAVDKSRWPLDVAKAALGVVRVIVAKSEILVDVAQGVVNLAKIGIEVCQ